MPTAKPPLKYHLAEDTIDQKDIDRLIGWLQSNPRLTKDRLTLQLEEKWSRWLGAKYSVFCNSGSSANLLMYYALLLSGRLKNKKVVVPSTGWVTSLAPAIQFGFEPLLCETDPDTFGLDLDYLESLLKQHEPASVMLVQVLGIPHKMEALLRLKEKYGFFLMEDTCAAVGSSAYGKKLGCFGDLGSFSFYFGHQASTIEGGMISTDDKGLYDLLLMLRSHGWSKDLDEPAHRSLVQKYEVDDFHRPFVFYEPGFNLRSTDLNAFIGLHQIEKLDGMATQRHENHLRYLKHLKDHFYVQRWEDPQAKISSIHFAAVAESREQRRSIINALTEHGIETRIFSAASLGRHPFWFNRYGKVNFPVADRIYSSGFFLPNHASLKAEAVDFIAQVVLEAVCVEKS
ncbi:MAG: DegT/DnrJ/EryC1/StrS family aminotransferase [Candidatus Omnitrophica bacterium]|nr:DegT/DnrJ/EryC1/StrS family aminotransferase [Candidatus Omnitrophota bacterium]